MAVTATKPIDFRDKARGYADLARQLEALLAGERHLIANAANTSSLLFYTLPDVNWVGFYLMENDHLVVGPFQGKPACVRITLDQGVCGAAARLRQTMLVHDVHDFPGHIACDVASNSEVVVPLIRYGELIGVLDVDSPTVGRFDEDDRKGLEELAEIFLANV